MGNVPFTVEEENLICIYHKHDRRRTIAAISDTLSDMHADMRPLAEQTIHKLHNMTETTRGAAADDGCCAPHFYFL